MRLTDILFPKFCLECKTNGRYLCPKCIKKVGFASGVCPMCTRPSIDGMTHTKCKKPFGMDGLIIVWKYKGVVKKCILKLKYQFAWDISEELANSITEALRFSEKVTPEDAILVPVPLHRRRFNWRGFNQAGVVGEKAAQRLGWKYVPELLIRKKNIAPQAQVEHKDDRLKNTLGAFAINKNQTLLHISQSNIVLFDDVWTTGATMREATKVLKRHGARSVWGMAIAH